MLGDLLQAIRDSWYVFQGRKAMELQAQEDKNHEDHYKFVGKRTGLPIVYIHHSERTDIDRMKSNQQFDFVGVVNGKHG